ncbi:STAS domain-containing protein [Actinocorallia aurantiaca]|uniref:STAS domain-containing protein n=1 Tax=Actinocorallia aurantiaca TaxID=46204 RepID=UPI0031DA1DAD
MIDHPAAALRLRRAIATVDAAIADVQAAVLHGSALLTEQAAMTGGTPPGPSAGERPAPVSSRGGDVRIPDQSRGRAAGGGGSAGKGGCGTALTVTAGGLGSYALVSLTGEIDASNSGWLGGWLSAAVDAAACGVAVDLAGVGFCDASGIGVLIGALKRCRGRGVGWEAAGAHDRVARVFHLTGVDQVLSLHPDLDGLLAALTARAGPAPEPVLPGAAPTVA